MNVMNINRCGYLLAALILLTFASCSKMSETDTDITQDGEGAFTETLTLKLDTKVTLSDALEAAWDNGDKIAVWTGTSETEGGFQTCMLSSNSITVSFQDETYHRYNYAVHYCGETLPSYTEGVLSVTLPDMYDYAEVSGTRNPVPMVAKSLHTDGSTLSFRAVGALARIALDGIPASTKYVEVAFDKAVTGSFVVSDPDSDAPYISASDASDMNVVTVTLPADGDNYAQYAGAAINVPVPQGEVSVTSVKAYDSERVLLATNVNGVLVNKWNALRAHAKKAKATFNPSFHNLIIAPGNLYTENGVIKISDNAYTNIYKGTATFYHNTDTYSPDNRTIFSWNELYVMLNTGSMPTYAQAGTVQTDKDMSTMTFAYGNESWHVGTVDEYKQLFGTAGAPQRPGSSITFTKPDGTEASKSKTRYTKVTVADMTVENTESELLRGIIFFPDNRNITAEFTTYGGSLDAKEGKYTAKGITFETLEDLINNQGCAFFPAVGHYTTAYGNMGTAVTLVTASVSPDDEGKYMWWKIESSRIYDPALVDKAQNTAAVRMLRPVE